MAPTLLDCPNSVNTVTSALPLLSPSLGANTLVSLSVIAGTLNNSLILVKPLGKVRSTPLLSTVLLNTLYSGT